MLRDGIVGPKDPAGAKPFLDQACSIGGPRYCGDGVGTSDKRISDDGKAADAHACTSGADSVQCMVTKVSRYAPVGGSAKLRPSRDFFQKQCDEKVAGGCYKLALIAHEENPMTARDAYDRACKAGSNEACVNLGYMYLMGEGGSEDEGKARLLFVAACDGGDAMGCMNQGSYVFTTRGVAKDDKLALAKFEQACAGGEAVACFNAGVMYNLGIATAADAVKAQERSKSACTDGVVQACKAKR